MSQIVSLAERAVGSYGDHAEFYRRTGQWSDRTIVEQFRAIRRRFPQNLAIATIEGSLTFEELDTRSDRFALGLVDVGLDPGSPVVFQLGNEMETVVAFYGVLKAGLIPVCSIPNHRLHELSKVAKASGARAHIFQADYRGYDLRSTSLQLEERCPEVKVRVVARGEAGEGALSMEEMIDAADPARARQGVREIQERVSSEAPAIFQLSGGTTGVPKVIPHTHATYLSVAARWSAHHGWDEHSRNLHFIPVMHHAGLGTVLVPSHFVGAGMVLARGVEPRQLAELIEKYRVSWLHLNMAGFEPLYEYSRTSQCDFSSVRSFVFPTVRPDASSRAEEMFGAVALATFGMGEGVHLSAAVGDPPEIRLDSVGRPIGPYDEVVVRQVDSEEPAADGELGEFTFRGPSVIRAYLSESDTATSFTSDGFLRSGDLGRALTVNGIRYYTYEGRLKDQISRGGEKFMAAELESLLISHPAVREVAAVGAPDPQLGERVCVFVVPAASARDWSPQELRAQFVEFLDRQQVAKFKWPERVEIVDRLPRTGTNKLRKDILRERLRAVRSEEGRSRDHQT
jgi:non-ribosomal peptide synthetase component E (peptide arylation enzyme)